MYVRTVFFENSAIVLDLRRGCYYSLGAVEARIWETIFQQRPLSEAICSIQREYNQPAETIAADAAAFLDGLGLKRKSRKRTVLGKRSRFGYRF
jgi:hypothetical protein